MKKIIGKCSFVFFILIALLIVTSRQSAAECIPGVAVENDGNVDYCPLDYPILCSTCVAVPGRFCCPESHSVCGLDIVAGCCTCAAEMTYKDNKESLTLIRKFRNNILSQSPIGREIIKLYYQWNPEIVKAMEADPQLKEEIKEVIDLVIGY